MTTPFNAHEFFVEAMPASFKDKSINIFSLTDEGPSDVSVVVARDRLREGETLEKYTQRQKGLMAQRMARFKLLGEGATQLDGQPAWWIDFEWVGPEGPMLQRQFLTLSPMGVALLVTGTFRGTPRPEALELFNQFLVGFHLRPAAG